MKIGCRVAMILVGGTLVPGVHGQDPHPEVGWTRDQVVEAMGQPLGLIRGEPLELLYYERGVIQLRDGLVASTDLVSADDAVRLRTERRIRAERESEWRAKRRKQLLEEGLAERDRMLADSSLNHLSADRQLAFWESFARRYPDVNVSGPILAARARWAIARERAEWRRRMDRLEQRVADAERRAIRAESAARMRPRTVYVPVPIWHPRAPRPCFPRRTTPSPDPPPPATCPQETSAELCSGFK